MQTSDSEVLSMIKQNCQRYKYSKNILQCLSFCSIASIEAKKYESVSFFILKIQFINKKGILAVVWFVWLHIPLEILG
mgnify:FL=1